MRNEFIMAGQRIIQWTNEKGRLHRNGGPAAVSYNVNTGAKIAESWYENGESHRLNGPANIQYAEDGKKRSEEWYVNGQLHREDGAAYIVYADGHVVTEMWYLDGELHRLDGPAVSKWLEGKVSHEWYLNGEKYQTEEDLILSAMAPGGPLWATEMGRFQRNYGSGIPRDLRNDCINASYSVPGYGKSGRRIDVPMKYTKEQLYYIGKGLDLPVKRSMPKRVLCSIISAALR